MPAALPVALSTTVKGSIEPGLLHGEAPIDLGIHLLGRRDRRIPKAPQLAIAHGLDQLIATCVGERLQRTRALRSVTGSGQGMGRVPACVLGKALGQTLCHHQWT